MDRSVVERMVTELIVACVSGRTRRATLVYRLAQRHPSAPALVLALVLAAAAHGLGSVLARGQSDARRLLRLAALVAGDVLVLELDLSGRDRRGPVPIAALLTYWGSRDLVFNDTRGQPP